MSQYRHATTSIIILTVIVIICQEIRKLKSLLVGHWKAFYLISLSFSLNIYWDYVPSTLQSILTHTVWFCAFTAPKGKYYHLFFTSRTSERVIILSFPQELESGAALWLHVWGFYLRPRSHVSSWGPCVLRQLLAAAPRGQVFNSRPCLLWIMLPGGFFFLRRSHIITLLLVLSSLLS